MLTSLMQSSEFAFLPSSFQFRRPPQIDSLWLHIIQCLVVAFLIVIVDET